MAREALEVNPPVTSCGVQVVALHFTGLCLGLIGGFTVDTVHGSPVSPVTLNLNPVWRSLDGP